MKILKTDNEKFEIKFTYNSLCKLENVLGGTISEIFAIDNLGFKTIRTLVWIGLLDQNKSLTELKTGLIIDDYFRTGKKLNDLLDLVMDALKEAGLFPEDTATLTKKEKFEEEENEYLEALDEEEEEEEEKKIH